MAQRYLNWTRKSKGSDQKRQWHQLVYPASQCPSCLLTDLCAVGNPNSLSHLHHREVGNQGHQPGSTYHGPSPECHYSCDITFLWTGQPQLNWAHKDKVAAHTHQRAILRFRELQTAGTTDCTHDPGTVGPFKFLLSQELLVGRAKWSAEAHPATAREHGTASDINYTLHPHSSPQMFSALTAKERSTVCLHNIYKASAQPALGLLFHLSL